MEITYTAQFCSRGSYERSADDNIHWFERQKWQNQYGKGSEYALNLIWFRYELNFYTSFETEAQFDKRILAEIAEIEGVLDDESALARKVLNHE